MSPEKPDSQEVGEKRKLSTDNNPVSAKKIVLNRNSVIEEIKVDKPSTEEAPKPAETIEPQKRVIKLSEVGIKEVKQ